MKFTFTLITILFTALCFGQINQVDANKRKQGPWKKYYPNTGALKYEGQFKDNKPYGVFTYYYKTGRVEAKVKFLKGGYITYSKMYHESSGMIKATGKYVNQKKDSTWTYFDNKGNVKSKEVYKDNKLEGQRVIYYEPVNGKYVVARYEYYKNDVLHGTYKEYHTNTKLKSEGQYVDGNLDGLVKFYYPNGKMERIERYKYAVEHGWWVFYDNTGKQIGERLFWEGKLLKGKALEAKKAELKAGR